MRSKKGASCLHAIRLNAVDIELPSNWPQELPAAGVLALSYETNGARASEALCLELDRKYLGWRRAD
eukprot:scaffold5435_cov124-Pinguiococcus_pyrenoidosus.AAC.1